MVSVGQIGVRGRKSKLGDWRAKWKGEYRFVRGDIKLFSVICVYSKACALGKVEGAACTLGKRSGKRERGNAAAARWLVVRWPSAALG